MDTSEEIKSVVRKKYTDVAEHKSSCGCGTSCGCDDDALKLAEGYSELKGYQPEADLQLGCGIPTAGSQIKAGNVVLDLGSGAGNDVFIARKLVGETGHVIGVDMTVAMIERASNNNRKFGFDNVEFRLGEVEELPVGSESIDVVISNCVLNLVPDKEKAFSEIYRVLKPGGRFSISDIVLTKSLPDQLRSVAELYAGCVSGASVKDDYLGIISRSGFVDVEVTKEVNIPLPQDLYHELTDDEAETFKNSGAGIVNFTVHGEKPV